MLRVHQSDLGRSCILIATGKFFWFDWRVSVKITGVCQEVAEGHEARPYGNRQKFSHNGFCSTESSLPARRIFILPGAKLIVALLRYKAGLHLISSLDGKHDHHGRVEMVEIHTPPKYLWVCHALPRSVWRGVCHEQRFDLTSVGRSKDTEKELWTELVEPVSTQIIGRGK